MGRLVKLLGSGIGLASEAISARKSSNASRNTNNAGEGSSRSASGPQQEAPPQYVEVPNHTADELIAAGKAVPADAKDPYLYDHDEKTAHEHEEDDSLSEEGDEEQWELDEAVPYPESHDDNAPTEDINVLTDTFMRNHPPPLYTPGPRQIQGRLPCPVIIPQRRPRDKRRGFVRAYAPVLMDCGIDQETFLEFLKNFHESAKEDKWLRVVNVSAMIAGMAPSAIVMGVSIAVQVSVGVAMEVQRRHRYIPFPSIPFCRPISSFHSISYLFVLFPSFPLNHLTNIGIG
jgi:hypothetical protein